MKHLTQLKFTLESEILFFDFHAFKTVLSINTNDAYYALDLCSGTTKRLPIQGKSVNQRHLLFNISQETKQHEKAISLIKNNNALFIANGMAVAFYKFAAVATDTSLLIIDLSTLHQLSIDTQSAISRLVFNSTGSLLAGQMDSSIVLYDTISFKQITVDNVVDFGFVGSNELVTVNGSEIYLVTEKNMDIKYFHLMDLEVSSIDTFGSFICVANGTVLTIFELKMRPLPQLIYM